jgi:acyl carrier protein
MTDRSAILDTLVRFLREDTTVETNGVTDVTDFDDGLALDSVDFVGLVMRLEGHYRVRIAQAELRPVRTVGDLISLVQDKLGVTAAAAA